MVHDDHQKYHSTRSLFFSFLFFQVNESPLMIFGLSVIMYIGNPFIGVIYYEFFFLFSEKTYIIFYFSFSSLELESVVRKSFQLFGRNTFEVSGISHREMTLSVSFCVNHLSFFFLRIFIISDNFRSIYTMICVRSP